MRSRVVLGHGQETMKQTSSQFVCVSDGEVGRRREGVPMRWCASISALKSFLEVSLSLENKRRKWTIEKASKR